MIRILVAFFVMLGIASPALADIKTGKFSTAQIFDVQWSISGSTLTTSGYDYLYRSVPGVTQMTAADYAAIDSAGQYFAFFDSTTNPGTYGMALYNSDGTIAEVIHNTGSFRALADGAIFYNGNGFWGTLITTAAGYSIGASASFTVEIDNPTNQQMSTWVPDSTTPLAAGQTADTTAPTLASSNPADNATGVAVGSNIVLTFSENIAAGTGNIVISDGSSDTRTIPIGDAQVTISGSTLTINPTADLNSSTTYYVQVAATAVDDLAGNSYAGITDTTTLNFTTAAPADTTAPTVTVTGPFGIVAEEFPVTITFSEAVTGFEASDVVTNGTVGNLTGSGARYLVTIRPTFGALVSVLVPAGVAADAAGNSNLASNSVLIPTASPASAFASLNETNIILDFLIGPLMSSIQNTLTLHMNMLHAARTRMNVARQQLGSGLWGTSTMSNKNVPLDVDGSFVLNGTTLSTRGNFFQQTDNFDGTQRKLFFGDFNVQHDADTGSTTATMTARVAWERMATENIMLGYFVGGELARSNISGALEGDQDRVGVTVGGYVVHQLDERLFLDGFLTFGAGRNDLDMANDILALTSAYTTRTASAGAALSGVYEFKQYDFRPELSFSYGKTWIGNIGFTGRAYGLVDDTLSLDAGNVSVANLTLRPEVIWALDAATVAESNTLMSFAPRAVCERTIATTRTENCGSGAELGIRTQSPNGLTNAEFRVVTDRVGRSRRTSYAINFEHRF